MIKINLNTICGIEWLVLSLYADVSMEIEGSIMGKDQHVVPHDGGWAVRGQETVKRPPFTQQSNLRWTLQEGLLQTKKVSL